MGKKIKLGKFEVNEDELEREFVEATQRGNNFLAEAPKAVKAKFDRETKRLILDLENGATLIVPTENIQGLRGAADKDLVEVELMIERTTLHWEKLDVDFRVSSLMNGIFGTRKWMSELNSKAVTNDNPQQKKVA